MSGHSVGHNNRMAHAANFLTLADPGDAGELRPGEIPRTPLHCYLGSASGAETRKLFPPSINGEELMLEMDVDNGDVVVTNRNQADDGTLAIDGNSNTIITFANVGESVRLVAQLIGTDYRWRIQGVANGAILSS